MDGKITLFMESTKKEPEQTISEIQVLLKQFRVRDVLISYDNNGNISALSFTVETSSGKRIPFKLPVDHMPIWDLAKRKKTKYIKTEDQARRVAWRQIFRWIQAQCALIQTQMVTIEEVFLPYLMVDDKTTIYDLYLNQGIDNNLLSSGF